jgi:hypothetical protein
MTIKTNEALEFWRENAVNMLRGYGIAAERVNINVHIEEVTIRLVGGAKIYTNKDGDVERVNWPAFSGDATEARVTTKRVADALEVLMDYDRMWGVKEVYQMYMLDVAMAGK